MPRGVPGSEKVFVPLLQFIVVRVHEENGVAQRMFEVFDLQVVESALF
jgi:hypothetical protein